MEKLIVLAPGEETVFSLDAGVRICRRNGAETRNYTARGFSFLRRENDLFIRRDPAADEVDEATEDVTLLSVDPASSFTDGVHKKRYSNVRAIGYRSDGKSCGILLFCDNAEDYDAQMNGQIETKRQEAAARNAALGSLQQEKDRLEAQIASLTAQIGQIRSENLDLENRKTQLEEQNAKQGSENLVLKASNDKLQAAAESLKAQFDAEQDRQTELNRMLAEYSEENTRVLKERNDALARRIVDARDRQKELSDQYAPLKSELDDISAENEALEQRIESQPEELRELQRAFETLSSRLEQIQNATQACSEEKQNELRQAIAELQPKAEHLEAEYRQLTAQRELLERICARQETENAVETDSILRLMEETLSQIGESLNRVAARRDDLSGSLNRLKDEFETCNQWLDSVEAPLLQMMRLAGLNRDEYETLNRTMNIDACSSVRNDIQAARVCLERLDGILRTAMNGIQQDNKRIERSAKAGVDAS